MIWRPEHENGMAARERELGEREARVGTREAAADEHATAITEREDALEIRERALRARAEAEAARSAREVLMAQMREANERLVLATLRADEAVEEAVATRALAAESATLEVERRLRAEALATQLQASENALRASESNARASIRAKDEFLAMLGHELRSPLAPILIALDLIAMDPADPHKREHGIIEAQVNQLLQLVDDLLDLARIASAKIELRRRPIEIAEVVSRAIDLARPVIEAKRHALAVEVPDTGLTVDGDLLRLTQVVGNLLTNAAKYTPSGGSIVITGELRQQTVVLRVRDSGIGISNAMLPRIFDLFAQEHQPSDGAPGGLGLGLAIVRSLVTLHGGAVTARSEGLGRGTELVVELPALATVDSTELSSVPSTVHTERPRRLLLVDDNRLVADLTALALRRLGHEVRVAYDGPSALAASEGFEADVVLLDVSLPGEDGYEVAKRLRSALSPHNAHFIAITGYGQTSDRRRSADAGFDDHLVKPVGLATLQESIDRSMQIEAGTGAH